MNNKRSTMPKAWKKVTPIPPEYNGHGYLYYCAKCGYQTTYVGGKGEPSYKCPKCEERRENK